MDDRFLAGSGGGLRWKDRDEIFVDPIVVAKLKELADLSLWMGLVLGGDGIGGGVRKPIIMVDCGRFAAYEQKKVWKHMRKFVGL